MWAPRLRFVIAILVWFTVIFRQSEGIFMGKRRVHIVNLVDSSQQLALSCWSKDDSLGVHYLKYKQDYDWEFYDDVFKQTRFECDLQFMQIGGKLVGGRFVVYDSKKKIRRRECGSRCIWGVGLYGLYAYDEGSKVWDYETAWPAVSWK